jgi:hypothetical protein
MATKTEEKPAASASKQNVDQQNPSPDNAQKKAQGGKI